MMNIIQAASRMVSFSKKARRITERLIKLVSCDMSTFIFQNLTLKFYLQNKTKNKNLTTINKIIAHNTKNDFLSFCFTS